MGLIFRQSLKSSVGYYIGVLLGALNTLFISTKFLEPDQLAISRILLENGLIFAAFSHLGTPYISDKFFSRFKSDENKHNGFLIFITVFPLLGISILLCFYYFFQTEIGNIFSDKSPVIIPYIKYTIPISIIWVYISVFESYSRCNGRAAVPTFLREVIMRVLNILLILLLGFGFLDFQLFIILYVITMAFIPFALIIYIVILKKWYWSWNKEVWNWSILREMALFGGVLILGGIGSNLVLFLDRNIIAAKIGPTEVAIFTVASYIAAIIEIPSKSIRQISSPIISDVIFRNDREKLISLYRKSALNLFLIGGITYLLIAVNLEQLFSVLPKSEIYEKGIMVVLIVGLAKWIDMSLGLNIEIIAFSKYYKLNTLLVILMAFMAFYLNILFIPYLGINGSALATASITLISSGIRLIFVYAKFKIYPFSKKDLPAFFVIMVTGMVGILFPSFGGNYIAIFLSIGIKSIFLLIIFLSLVIKFNISEDINVLFKKISDQIFKASK